jgi:hypothetical protein
MNLGKRGTGSPAESCPPPGCCGLTAESGTAAGATLTGCPEDDQVRRSRASAVRHVEGVTAVRDRLSNQTHRR